MGCKILIVDDEMQIRKLLKVALGAHGYLLEEVSNGKDALVQAAIFKPDLLIVDLGLPDLDGKEVVKGVREWSNVPIIVLTARNQEQEKIAALDLGADDYVTKPFSTGELMARIRVCLRRNGEEEETPIIKGNGLEIDLVKHLVTVDGNVVKLTPTEYELIKVLAQNAGRVMTHKQLLKTVWGNQYNEDTHYIRIYIGQIRRKLEKNPTQPQYILTESGVGYRLMI